MKDPRGTGPCKPDPRHSWTMHKNISCFGGPSECQGVASGAFPDTCAMNRNGPFYFATWEANGEGPTSAKKGTMPWKKGSMVIAKTKLVFRNPKNGKACVAIFADRGPASFTKRYLDLGQNVADYLGLDGTGDIEWDFVSADDVLLDGSTPAPPTPEATMAFDTSHKSRYTAGAMSKADVDYIVLHRTEGHIAGDLSVLTGGGSGHVSIHFLIGPDGHVYQMVPMTSGANHAGFGTSGLAAKYGNANHHAYGIELSGMAGAAYPEAQLKALDTVIAYIDKYLGRKVEITTHKAVDPGRKSDPDHFTWLAQYNKTRTHGVPVPPKPLFTPDKTPVPDLGPGVIYRLIRPDKDYLLSTSLAECRGAQKANAKGIGYNYEGPAFTAPALGDVEVWRFLRTADDFHFYTANSAERDSLLADPKWELEDVAFSAFATDAEGRLTVKRFYNGHTWLWSAQPSEIAGLAKEWHEEGPAFYV